MYAPALGVAGNVSVNPAEVVSAMYWLPAVIPVAPVSLVHAASTPEAPDVPVAPVGPIGPVSPVAPVAPVSPTNPVVGPTHVPVEFITVVDPTVNPFFIEKVLLFAKVHHSPLNCQRLT